MTGSASLLEVIGAYQGSDAGKTLKLLGRLEELGPIGRVAACLFRAQKASERAKVYRGRGYVQAAYGRKDNALGDLAAKLEALALISDGLPWGWGTDPAQPKHCHVLYVDLPTGQVSFHAGDRGDGPAYPGSWDGRPGQSPDRILRWCARLLDGRD